MSLAPMQAPSFMAKILSALNKKKASTAPGAVLPVPAATAPPPALLAAPPSVPPALQQPAQDGQIWGVPFPMVEEQPAPVEEEVNPLGLYRPGSLSLPSRQYDIPQAPTMRGLPELPVRDMAQDSRRGLDAAGIGALAGLLLGGGRGAVAGTLGAGRGYMAGRDRVAAQDRQNYGDQLNQTLRLNNQDQQGFANQMAGLSRQMIADNAADANRARVFSANETANRGAFTANATARDKAAQTAIKRDGLALKARIEGARTEAEKKRLAGQLAKWAVDAQMVGVRMADIDNDNKLAAWLAQNNVAQGMYRAETGRIMANNGLTLGTQRNVLAQQGLNLRQQEIENRENNPSAQTSEADKAQRELLTIQQGFPKVDAQLAKLKKQLRDGNPVPVTDPVTGLQTGWKTVPLSPAEAQDVQAQIQGLQTAKQAAAQRGQQLKLRAGATLAPPAELPRTPAAGRGKTAAVGVKLTPTANKAGGNQVKTKSGNVYTFKVVN